MTHCQNARDWAEDGRGMTDTRGIARRGLAAATDLWRWLAPALWRSLGLLDRLAQRFGRWIAARPWRALDLSVAAITALALLALWQPTPAPQSALLTPELDYDSSLDCLALNIYHEARGEPQDGQLAVAQVVMNRVADQRFPNNVCGVVKQGGEVARGRCQFSWWCDGRSDRPGDARAWQESLALAQGVLAGEFEDPTGGALWYHADYVAPAWGMAIKKGPKIGRHIFYASASE